MEKTDGILPGGNMTEEIEMSLEELKERASRACRHGGLRRSCEICDLHEQLDEKAAEIDQLQKQLEEAVSKEAYWKSQAEILSETKGYPHCGHQEVALMLEAKLKESEKRCNEKLEEARRMMAISEKRFREDWDVARMNVADWSTRAVKAEDALAEKEKEIENLAWNLGECTTLAESRTPTDYNERMARPALHAVYRLVNDFEQAKKECAAYRYLAIGERFDKPRISFPEAEAWVDREALKTLTSPAPKESTDRCRCPGLCRSGCSCLCHRWESK